MHHAIDYSWRNFENVPTPHKQNNAQQFSLQITIQNLSKPSFETIERTISLFSLFLSKLYFRLVEFTTKSHKKIFPSRAKNLVETRQPWIFTFHTHSAQIVRHIPKIFKMVQSCFQKIRSFRCEIRNSLSLCSLKPFKEMHP